MVPRRPEGRRALSEVTAMPKNATLVSRPTRETLEGIRHDAEVRLLEMRKEFRKAWRIRRAAENVRLDPGFHNRVRVRVAGG